MAIPAEQRKTEPPAVLRGTDDAASRTAHAYDHVGEQYGIYADGAEHSLGTLGRYAHGDRIVWQVLCDILEEIRRSGRRVVRICDAGCGPGTWLLRLCHRADQLGLAVDAIGFDISEHQLALGRERIKQVETGSNVTFVRADLCRSLPWGDGEFDLVLSNYTVLNHLPRASFRTAIAELCRVSRGWIVSTLRAIGSPPTAYIIGMERVRAYRQNHEQERIDLILDDGEELSVTSNLYSAETIKTAFSAYATYVDCRAIDIFGRLIADARWTADLQASLPGWEELRNEWERLEEAVCRKVGWVDHGTHVLVVAGKSTGSGRWEMPLDYAGALVATANLKRACTPVHNRGRGMQLAFMLGASNV